MSTTGTVQSFKVHEMTGDIRLLDITIYDGCDLHELVSDVIDAELKQLGPYDPDDPSRKRKFRIVFGYDQLDELHAQLFVPGAQDKPDYDDQFDQYYYHAYLTADKQSRTLRGRQFAENTFANVQGAVSLHVTIALS